MLVHPEFDPIAIQIGPVAVRWYGLMYLVGFIGGLLLARWRVRRHPDLGWSKHDIDDLLFYCIIGVVLGGRLGYVLFYKLGEYLHDPIKILYLWEGGMSFHGGFLGVILAMAWYARRSRRHWFAVTDFLAPLAPIGLGAGRLGNFINGELWGRAADPSLPWAMVFPQSGSAVARHPSQLYQMLLEGLLLFVLLWWYARRPRGLGQVSGAFLAGYGLFRFIAEFFRQPDSFLGLLALGMSMGQWLCLPMIAAGVLLWAWAGRRAG